jgi:glycosyltransferase involved in cell wall biosynthesis
MIGIFGENSDYRDKTTIYKRCLTLLQDVGFALFKKGLYRKAVDVCDILVMNVPETEQFFKSYLKDYQISQFLDKRIHLNLGYDPDEFFFDENERKKCRLKYNFLKDDIVYVTSTRVNRGKKFESIIDAISKTYKNGTKVKYIIIGFLGDSYEKELKNYISSQPYPEIFYCIPFTEHTEIRKIYCASDIGIWIKPAISIQESMGTGLPVVLENKRSVDHLIRESLNGWYFEKGQIINGIEKGVFEMAKKDSESRIKYRKDIAKLNSDKYSYHNIAKRIIDCCSSKILRDTENRNYEQKKVNPKNG